MGQNIILVSKDRGDRFNSYHEFSRSFCTFICGRDAYQKSEFKQIEKITGIDLSVFKNFPDNIEPSTDELRYELQLVQKKGDAEKMKEIEAEIEKIEKEWEESYESIDEGWTQVEELRTTTELLINSVEKNRDIFEQLDYNFDWGDYFQYEFRGKKSECSCVYNTFIEDLKLLVKGLEEMDEKGVTLVTFDLM